MPSRVSPNTTVIFLSLTDETAQHQSPHSSWAVSLKEALANPTLVGHISDGAYPAPRLSRWG